MTVQTEGAPTGESTEGAPTGVPQGQEQGGEQETPYDKALRIEREEVKRLKTELAKKTDAEEKARLEAMDDNARAIEEAKSAVRAEVAEEYEAKMLGLRAQARASAFHDPELAVSLAGLAGGASDAEIDAALAALAKEKPYLVKAAGGVPPVPQGPRSSGAPAVDPNDWIRQAVAAKNG